MCFSKIHVLLFLNKLLLPISYHGHYLFISNRFLKSPLEKLIPHAKIHRQSPKRQTIEESFSAKRDRGRRPLINTVYTRIVQGCHLVLLLLPSCFIMSYSIGSIIFTFRSHSADLPSERRHSTRLSGWRAPLRCRVGTPGIRLVLVATLIILRQGCIVYDVLELVYVSSDQSNVQQVQTNLTDRFNFLGGPKPTALQQADVPVTGFEECRRLYRGKRAIIDEKVICAGNIRRGTCMVRLLSLSITILKLQVKQLQKPKESSHRQEVKCQITLL